MNGCRIPSTADEDFAETQSADFAFAADRKNRFDLESFIAEFYSLPPDGVAAVSHVARTTPSPAAPPLLRFAQEGN